MKWEVKLELVSAFSNYHVYLLLLFGVVRYDIIRFVGLCIVKIWSFAERKSRTDYNLYTHTYTWAMGVVILLNIHRNTPKVEFFLFLWTLVSVYIELLSLRLKLLQLTTLGLESLESRIKKNDESSRKCMQGTFLIWTSDSILLLQRMNTKLLSSISPPITFTIYLNQSWTCVKHW